MEQPSKQERYFSGMRPPQDPSQPLPGEIPVGTKAAFIKIGISFALFAAGVMTGLYLANESPAETKKQIAELQADLSKTRARLAEVNRALTYNRTDADTPDGLLSPKDRTRHEVQGKRYAAALRRAKAQPAAELVHWFVRRWNELIDRPEEDDITGRRATTLTHMLNMMSRNLNPEDYIAWQSEFLDGNWLGELHFDIDGDGYPGKRKKRDNPTITFANESVCHIAMTLNQLATDAQVLMQPGLNCVSPRAKISVFLQGRTVDDALDEFVRSTKSARFNVKDANFKGTRMIMIGPGRRGN